MLWLRSIAATSSLHAVTAGEYVKVINGRCTEAVGVLPLGRPGVNWTRKLDSDARVFCDSDDRCVGYMRYMGLNKEHCDAWCGRPQFCEDIELSADEQWVSYLRADALERQPEGDADSLEQVEDQFAEEPAREFSAPGPEHVNCPWPFTGSATLWFEAEGEDAADEDDFPCRVFYHQLGRPLPKEVSGTTGSRFHGILSESEEVVPYFTAFTASGPWIYHVDSNSFIGDTLWHGGASLGPKVHYLSIFFLSESSRCDGKTAGQWGPEESEAALPGHVFIEDGSVETRTRAFNPYHFTIICGEVDDASFVPQALVDAIGFAAHPLILQKLYKRMNRVFFHLQDAAQPYTRIHPLVLEDYVGRLYNDPEKNDAMYFKQTFLFLLQDLFRYRYRQHPRTRLEVAACGLCEERQRRQRLVAVAAAAEGSDGDEPITEELAAAAVGVVVCVMSRRSGHMLRAAIRKTWAQRLGGSSTTGISLLRFFVGSAVGDAEDVVADLSSTDVVELKVPESYKAVTLKAFSMLDWTYSRFPNLRWLIRADDDVYLRPGPLLAQLEQRAPIAYLWGNIDHGSNPVRDPGHHHYNSKEQYPVQKHPLFGDIFPPYARGHLWAMSADLLALVVDVWRGERMRHRNLSLALARQLPHPDDPALGVALSNLVEQDMLSLNIDDRDLNVFALNPSCNATYLNIHNRTWVVHHVDPGAMHCMWAIDSAADDCTYSDAEPGKEKCGTVLPDLCPCSMEVVEEVDPVEDVPFDYPRDRFNE